MTSFGEVQYPQNPFLSGTTINNYDDSSQSRGGNYYRQPFIPIHEDPYTSSGSSGYGDSAPSGYGPQPHYPVHTGPSSTGYGAPVVHAPPPLPPPTKPSVFGGLKKGANSAMSALTLLSFFFFVNLLQSCLKEHMDTMNPTVMVMTTGRIRNRNTKLAEINSREQSTSPGSITPNEHIVVQPDTLIAAAAATTPPATIAATLTVASQSKPPAENIQILNNNNDAHAYPTSTNVDHTNLNAYDSAYSYPNRTTMSSSSSAYPSSDRYRPQQEYYDDHYFSIHRGERHPWSNRPHSYYGHSSPGYSSTSYWDQYENRNFPNHDFYDDTSYLRIY